MSGSVGYQGKSTYCERCTNDHTVRHCSAFNKLCNECGVKLHHCVKAASDKTSNQEEDHIVELDREMAEASEPHNDLCISQTFRNQLKMLLTFFIRVWYSIPGEFI